MGDFTLRVMDTGSHPHWLRGLSWISGPQVRVRVVSPPQRLVRDVSPLQGFFMDGSTLQGWVRDVRLVTDVKFFLPASASGTKPVAG